MNDKDLQTIIAHLQRAKPALPRHQQALKARLLTQHAHQQTFGFRFLGHFTHNLTGVFTMKSKIAAGLAVAVLVAGAAFLLTVNGQVSALELATKAYDKTSQMPQAEIDAKNEQYKQNIKQRLQQAKASANLKKIDLASAKELLGATNHDASVKQYLSYNDNQNHQIVIGLDAQREPVSVFDVEQIRGADTPTMEVRDGSSGSPLQGSSTQVPNR